MDMSTDINGARGYFTTHPLSDCPGQNVGNLATNALKLIKSCSKDMHLQYILDPNFF